MMFSRGKSIDLVLVCEEHVANVVRPSHAYIFIRFEKVRSPRVIFWNFVGFRYHCLHVKADWTLLAQVMF